MRRVVTSVIGSFLIAAMATACNSGDGGLTIEEYFTELERIIDDAEQRSDALPTPDLTNGSFETSRDQLANLYDEYAVIAEDVVDELGDLDAPDGVSGEHERFTEALRELPPVSYNYANGIRDAETESDFETAFNDTSEGEAVGERVNTACNALQTIADDSDIGVDLQCDES